MEAKNKMAKVRSYNYIIEEEKEWEKFSKNYKKKGIGKNLNEALTSIIREHNKTK